MEKKDTFEDGINNALFEDLDNERWEKWAREEEAKYNQQMICGYKEFLDFLAEEEVANTRKILQAINDCDRVEFIGYVDGELSVKNNELKITVEVPDRCGFNGKETAKIECDWQHSDNYGVHQRCDFEDSYYGWMIFPCWDFKRFYCVYYTC